MLIVLSLLMIRPQEPDIYFPRKNRFWSFNWGVKELLTSKGLNADRKIRLHGPFNRSNVFRVVERNQFLSIIYNSYTMSICYLHSALLPVSRGCTSRKRILSYPWLRLLHA